MKDLGAKTLITVRDVSEKKIKTGHTYQSTKLRFVSIR
jgi:hypothetical protein